MKGVKLWSVAWVAVAVVGAATVHDGTLISPNPRDTYLDCLAAKYAEDSGEISSVAWAYAQCRPAERPLKKQLLSEGMSAEAAQKLIERMNEVAFARFHDLELSATRGCFDIIRREIPLS